MSKLELEEPDDFKLTATSNRMLEEPEDFELAAMDALRTHLGPQPPETRAYFGSCKAIRICPTQ